MWTVDFHKSPLVQYSHFIEIGDGVQLMRYGDDSVTGEFLPDDALDQRIGYVVQTIIILGQYLYTKDLGRRRSHSLGVLCAGGDRRGTYLLVASSRTRIELCLNSA